MNFFSGYSLRRTNVAQAARDYGSGGGDSRAGHRSIERDSHFDSQRAAFSASLSATRTTGRLFGRIRNMDANSSRFSFPDYHDFRQRNQTFAEIGGQEEMRFNLTGHERPEMLHGTLVSASFWKVLGVSPQLGRTFTADEDAAGIGAPVVVISDSLWQRIFARDPKVLGATMQLNDHPYTVDRRDAR